MGTNYYVNINPCPTCGRAEEQLHIGKSSAGWCFSLHVIPEKGLNGLHDWERFWADKHIVDEYGKEVPAAEMEQIIAGRSWHRTGTPFGYSLWETFHEENDSQDGPNGLLRHRINGWHCIGHGEGTWDLIAGEFS